MTIDPLSAAAIGAGAWFWDKYGKEITDGAIAKIKARWKKFEWKKAAEKYRDSIKEQYSSTRILYKTETVSVIDLYIDLFVIDEPSAFRRYGVDNLAHYFDDREGFLIDKSQRENALHILSQLLPTESR